MSSAEPHRTLSSGAYVRRRILLLGSGLILLIIGVDTYEAWRDYQTSLRRSQQIVELLSRAFANQTGRLVQDLDFALEDFAVWAQHSDSSLDDRAALAHEMKSRITRLPFVQTAAVLDASGSRIDPAAPVGDPPDKPAWFHDLTVQSNDGNSLHIGRPWTSRRDGNRTFAVSRRLADSHGAFAGIVLARVSFDYLGKIYETVNVSPGMIIRLKRADGVTLATYPQHSDDPDNASNERGLWASHAVSGYPVRMEVSQSRHEALTDWRQQEMESFARTGALALLAATLLGAILVTLKRRELADDARRESEARLQEARRAEALSLLAASVAHDFNNVLGAIVGYAELVQDVGQKDPQIRLNVDRLLGAAERARQLVRRVLTLDPHRSIRDEPVVLAPIVREVVDQLQARGARSRVFSVVIDDPALTVFGDSTEIYQILLNLCSNAVQATPAGGQIEIQLRQWTVDQPAAMIVGQISAGDYIVATVSDQGPGIDDERVRRIFDPLTTTKTPGDGIGIGLTVVRTIVERMRGAIDVGSGPMGGALFTVYWPRHPGGSAEGTVAPAQYPAGHGVGQVVMIVDDEPQLVSVLEDLIASMGYEPMGFTDPVKALEAMRRAPARFDAMVTDERMPGMRGLELIQRIRESSPQLPAILVTGYRSAEIDQEASRLGVAHVLDKPVRKNELERALSQIILRPATSVPVTTEMENLPADIADHP